MASLKSNVPSGDNFKKSSVWIIDIWWGMVVFPSYWFVVMIHILTGKIISTRNGNQLLFGINSIHHRAKRCAKCLASEAKTFDNHFILQKL
jgi:hypothetical protein